MQADENKVAALASIFGGQDITASVIRTVLSSNDNKFDEAVDSLLNMTTSDENSNGPAPTQNNQELDEEALLDKKEREKLRTLENMFGNDLSQSVICTVLESNRGELVDAVDTLLNMTSKEINPSYSDVNQREVERARQEEELKNYEDFKKLQLALQEEEARAIKEQQQRVELELRKASEAAAAQEQKHKDILQEQDRIFREFQSQKQQQEDAAKNAQEAKRQTEDKARKEAEQKRERELEEAQEKLRKAWEEKLTLLNAEEEKIRQLQVKQQAEEEARRVELLARERAWAEKEEQLQIARRQEEARIAERKAELEAQEKAKGEELARLRREAVQREVDRKRVELQQLKHIEQLRAETEAKALKQKLEDEEREHQRRIDQERRELEHRLRLEEERLELQREKAKFEALRMAEEVRIEEERRMRTEQEERKRMAEQERLQRAEEQRRAEAARIEEEEAIRVEEERLAREEAEMARLEKEREKARLEEEMRNQQLKEEAERVQSVFEEERRKKSAIDLIAASAVFIPPRAEASADQITISAVATSDTVSVNWDLPEGNATTTNWLGLYPIRALPNTNKYVQFVYTNGAHTGQHIFRGVTPGHYEVRFFATRLYAHTACSSTVRVGPTPTLGVQLQGDHLLVYYTLDPISATPTREWLGIYEKTQRRNKKYLSSAYGNAEGQVMLKAPRNPGVYEVRLFASGAAYNEQAKCEFTVEDNDCVTVSTACAPAGSAVDVRWVLRTVEPSSGDWIGLYKADETNNGNYLSCTYTQGGSVGSVSVTVPKENGVYEVRLFAKAKGRYTTFRISLPLVVVDAL